MPDPHHPPWLLKIIRTDWVLAVALCVGLLFSVYGMTWGSGQSWHPDEMAFRGLFSAKTLPFEPMSFNRPPFYTYFNYFLSVLPFDLLQQTASKLVGSPVNLGIVRLYWSSVPHHPSLFWTVCCPQPCFIGRYQCRPGRRGPFPDSRYAGSVLDAGWFLFCAKYFPPGTAI
jgi:hypothetical protein